MQENKKLKEQKESLIPELRILLKLYISLSQLKRRFDYESFQKLRQKYRPGLQEREEKAVSFGKHKKREDRPEQIMRES